MGNGVTALHAVKDAAAAVRADHVNLWAAAKGVWAKHSLDQPRFQAICGLAGAVYHKGLMQHPGTIKAIEVRCGS
jgi:hypothetical protein